MEHTETDKPARRRQEPYGASHKLVISLRLPRYVNNDLQQWADERGCSRAQMLCDLVAGQRARLEMQALLNKMAE